MDRYKYLIIVGFLLLTSALFGQTQLLKNYAFETGGYAILGLRSSSDYNGLADSLKDFYIDDITILSNS